jgi:hypothetical protein
MENDIVIGLTWQDELGNALVSPCVTVNGAPLSISTLEWCVRVACLAHTGQTFGQAAEYVHKLRGDC